MKALASLFGGMLATLAFAFLLSAVLTVENSDAQQSTVGGSSARPRFQAVGIGTSPATGTQTPVRITAGAPSTPSERAVQLDVFGGDARIGASTTTSGNASLNLDTTGVQNWSIINRRSDGTLVFSAAQDATAARMTLTSSGVLAVGALTVNGITIQPLKIAVGKMPAGTTPVMTNITGINATSTRTGVGSYIVNYLPAGFSTVPACTTGGAANATFSSMTSTSVNVSVSNSAGSGADNGFDIICFGT